tara:strand:+ start:561 stop:752 length:192 start_codon:yes stop_codon:yes gene_type:complete
MKKKLKGKNTINNIQKIRAKNNNNWMDLLRIALKHAPNETKKILKKINSQDKKIASLLKKLTH